MSQYDTSTTSTFGTQVLSNRVSEPRYGVVAYSGQRTNCMYDPATEHLRLGVNSQGHNHAGKSSFGEQHASKNATSPAYKIGQKLDRIGQLRGKAIGPGDYKTEASIGKQISSQRCNSAEPGVLRGSRWAQYRNLQQGYYQTPGPGNPRLTAGNLGDSPAYRFHGAMKRYQIGKGLPGYRPTTLDTPAPVMYNHCSAFGEQVQNHRPTSPSTKVGKSQRDQIYKQFISKGHQKVLYGRNSPGPNKGRMSSFGPQKESNMKSTGNFKFGTSSRFSEIKPRNDRVPAINPGPGTYRV